MFNLFVNVCFILPGSILVGGLIGSVVSAVLGPLGFWLVGICTGVIFFAKYAMFDDHSDEPDAHLSPDELYAKYKKNHSEVYMFFLALYLAFKYGDSYKKLRTVAQNSPDAPEETSS